MIEQINPNNAWKDLRENPNSILVDVRTTIEHKFVGVVNDSKLENKMILLEWLIFPLMEENNEFQNQIEESLNSIFKENIKETKLYFLCKTGVRSNMAAQFMSNLGYKNCYNIINGFEGDYNEKQQRGFVNGWKANNLPWIQN